MIKKLEWDSDFFGFQIGEIENDTCLSDSNIYDLIILKQKIEKRIEIKNFKNTFQETKVVFNKILDYSGLYSEADSVIDFDYFPIDKEKFYPLAFESGKYSRFKLDTNFTHGKFELLYSKWVDNSITKEFADKILYVKENDQVIGFVTIKNNINFSTIGLIAVAENQQGKGIGKKMLLKAEEYCISNGIPELRIPTQNENAPACLFYRRMGYNIKEEIVLKHYWKEN